MQSLYPNYKIILASQSPRRRELLAELTRDFEVMPSPVDEIMRADLSPEENALAVAREKALWAAQKCSGFFVLGADTIVVLDGNIIGKPADTSDATRILKYLGGRKHQVITGVAIVAPDGRIFEEARISSVEFKLLTDAEIADYIATGEPMDKAGAYAIQGRGSFMVKSYEGSFSNIVGLPMETVKKLLSRANYEFGLESA